MIMVDYCSHLVSWAEWWGWKGVGEDRLLVREWRVFQFYKTYQIVFIFFSHSRKKGGCLLNYYGVISKKYVLDDKGIWDKVAYTAQTIIPQFFLLSFQVVKDI